MTPPAWLMNIFADPQLALTTAMLAVLLSLAPFAAAEWWGKRRAEREQRQLDEAEKQSCNTWEST